MQSVPITTNVVSLNPAHGEVYSIQLYVVKIVSDWWEVWELFLGTPPIKMTTNDIAEIVVESGVKHP